MARSAWTWWPSHHISHVKQRVLPQVSIRYGQHGCFASEFWNYTPDLSGSGGLAERRLLRSA